MKKVYSIHPILVFVLAQLAWLSLLGIWITWYVSNYIIFNRVGDKISPQMVPKTMNIVALVLGLVLLGLILAGMYLIFIYLNRQLQVTKMYDNFIANVSHELKSPLASIQLYLETMSRRRISYDRRKEFIELMLKDTRRLRNLIDSILDVSAIEQRKIAHSFQIYTTQEIFPDLINESISKFKLSDTAYTIECNADGQCVLDRNAMLIVIDNLIDNALKYCEKLLNIKFEVTTDKKWIHIKVSDNGVGLPPKQTKKIFKKFHRVYDKKSPNVKGTGLGLYWVKEIIKYHGGKVSAKSAGWHKGSTFIIELPIYGVSKKGFLKKILKRSQMHFK
ncbi:HAMP domain-containing histidine kinase [candidate division KSB1 bacterium]|nr:HAMP domain-containing histidine kinase [candidate division KSB1 bacterium]